MTEESLKEEIEGAIERNEPFGPIDDGEPQREVEAKILRDAILARTVAGSSKRLWLRRVEITGGLNLEAQTIGLRLVLDDCTVKGDLNLSQAHALSIDLFACTIEGSLIADQMEMRWNLQIARSKIGAGVSLLGAKIEGHLGIVSSELKGPVDEKGDIGAALDACRLEVREQVSCNELSADGELRFLDARFGAHFSARQASLKGSSQADGSVSPAFNADRIRVNGSSFCEGLSADGEMRLLNAKIGGQLMLQDAELKGTVGKDGPRPSFSADGMDVRGDLFFDGTSATGEMRLFGAKVHGQLSFEYTDLKGFSDGDGNPQNALSAERVEVTENLYCTGMLAEGKVELLGAKVGGQLGLVAGRLIVADAEESCLSLVGAEIDELILAVAESRGVIDLTDVSVRSLWDAENGDFIGELPETLCLRGFHYESLREPLRAEQRLDWVNRSQRNRHYPEVYAELADAYRRIGRRADAREIGIANERRARRNGSGLYKVWNYLLWITVRYGYENWRAAVGLLTVIAIGSLTFCLAESHFVATVLEPPSLSPVIYATDAAIPVLDLGQTDAWATTGWLEWVELGLAASGYALVAAVIAGLAGIFNRDQV